MRKVTVFLLLIAAALPFGEGVAGEPGQGFQLGRYTPTPAGQSLLTVEHPVYSSARYVAVAWTFDYGHNAFVAGIREETKVRRFGVIEHQLAGHLDVAASAFDRLLFTFSLPVTLVERGQGIPGLSPLGAPAVGDPRLGLSLKLAGDAERDPISLHFSQYVFLPVGAAASHAGDGTLRVMPRLVAAGRFRALRWAVNLAYLVRGPARVGQFDTAAGSTVGHELRLGAALGYAGDRFHLGPEVTYGTIVSEGKPFEQSYSSLELLVAGQYTFFDQLQVGAAVGAGLLRAPGTPDARALLRLAWAPRHRRLRSPAPPPASPRLPPLPVAAVDRDGDGIADGDDACPEQAGVQSEAAARRGCPGGDLANDQDGDGVVEGVDLCPRLAAGPTPDPGRTGCPAGDRDGDGVPDPADRCPADAATAAADPNRPGCPAADEDGDHVLDHRDACPKVPAGPSPDPVHLGCPAADSDGDGILDPQDRCPDQRGAPAVGAKSGCPGLVELRDGQLALLQPIVFGPRSDLLAKRSQAVLLAVADALAALPWVKRLLILAHTDDRGSRESNIDLSDRRARRVRSALIGYGINARRLDSMGYGPDRPLGGDRKLDRAKNDRIELHLIDPPLSPEAGSMPAAAPGN